jgi:uncharacterized protein YeaO (DUF488 family)
LIRTSYISNVKNIEKDFDEIIFITRYLPETIKLNSKYMWLKNLSPNQRVLKMYKDKLITFEELADTYLKELKLYSLNTIKEIIKKSRNGKKICLCCFEKDREQCHRKILAEVIKYIGKEEVKEVS